ncbi:MAG: helical backbone metal receptor [Verrucomicrobiota bacterium]
MIRQLTFLCILTLLYGCGKPVQPTALAHPPERIISLAPNITETIYALDLGDKLVGATTYCTYPEAARVVPRIGGFGQFNYEAIVIAQPDLVILHKEYETVKARLQGLGIPYLETGTYFIVDILETIRDIGEACGAQERAEELVAQLEDRIVELQTTSTNRPRVLITFGSEDVESIQAFGPECIHNELLGIAGGKNIVEGGLPFAVLSREAVLRLNPDIIIELAPGLENTGHPSRRWEKLDAVNAVKNNRIHVLTGDYTCIPGPRFIQTLEDFSRIIKQNN